MKTNEELNALNEEVEAQNKKLAELNEKELKSVNGGISWGPFHDAVAQCPYCKTSQVIYELPFHCRNCTATVFDFDL